MDISVEDILAKLDQLPEKHRAAISVALSRYNKAKLVETAKSDFLTFF